MRWLLEGLLLERLSDLLFEEMVFSELLLSVEIRADIMIFSRNLLTTKHGNPETMASLTLFTRRLL